MTTKDRQQSQATMSKISDKWYATPILRLRNRENTSWATTSNNIIVAILGETNSQQGRQYHQDLHDEPEKQHPQIRLKL
jgi:hypothetical protein